MGLLGPRLGSGIVEAPSFKLPLDITRGDSDQEVRRSVIRLNLIRIKVLVWRVAIAKVCHGFPVNKVL
jgi:hypothetical protein